MTAKNSRRTRKQFMPQIGEDASLVPVQHVHKLDPSWPFSAWSTWKLMRTGRLGFKRVGRRYFVTKAHLEAFARDEPVRDAG